jgi:hypothetical protein
MSRIGLYVRAGVHTDEVEVINGMPGGLAVSIGARIAATAHADEVLVSQTVKDLVVGSGLACEQRGTHVLKGVPGQRQLFARPARRKASTRRRVTSRLPQGPACSSAAAKQTSSTYTSSNSRRTYQRYVARPSGLHTSTGKRYSSTVAKAVKAAESRSGVVPVWSRPGRQSRLVTDAQLLHAEARIQPRPAESPRRRGAPVCASRRALPIMR